MSKKNTIRLTESDLKRVIFESVKRILIENEMIPEYIPLETGITYDWDDYDVYADVLYNTRTKSIEIEKYGHGMGASIEGSGDIESAIQNGLCNERDVRMAVIERLSGYLIPNHNTVSIALESFVGEKLAIPCKVSRSRNIKGDCILLQVVEKRNNFRPYYGRSFDSQYDTYFQVYSEATNTIAEVGVNTVSFSDDVIENIKNETINVLMSMDLQTLIHLCAYRLSYAAVDSQKLARYGRQACLTAIQNLYGKEYNIPDNVVNPQQAKKDEKQKAFKEKKMPELIAWAKSVHPDWSEEEINALAEKVWNKRYA
jgi:hypothetical protein